jgi:hypothetical protein
MDEFFRMLDDYALIFGGSEAVVGPAGVMVTQELLKKIEMTTRGCDSTRFFESFPAMKRRKMKGKRILSDYWLTIKDWFRSDKVVVHGDVTLG